MPRIYVIILLCLLAAASPVRAAEKPAPVRASQNSAPVRAETLSPEDLKVVAVMEILQLMDMAEDMDMVNDFNYLIEDEQNGNPNN
jgi:hypothetical protein